jgi:cyclase
MRLAHLLPLLPALAASAQSPGNYRVETLAPGVHAVVRLDPIAFVNNANSLIVVGDSAVLVVDAQFTRAATLETIAAVRSVTRHPVRHLVVTHWHDDHFAGAQVYRDTFPGVRVIAHGSTRADLIAQGRPNRAASWNVGPGFTARLERLLASQLGVDSTPATPGERRAMESVIAVGRRYVAEKDGFRETLPDLTFDDRLSLHLGARRVDLYHFGPANTRGDAIAHVPDAGVVATGDLLVHPIPFAFGAFPRGWRGALDSVAALRAAVVLPGHGPALRDVRYLRLVRDALDSLGQRVNAAVTRGADRTGARSAAALDDFRERFAGSDPWLRALFTRFFLDPAFARAHEEATARATPPDSARVRRATRGR